MEHSWPMRSSTARFPAMTGTLAFDATESYFDVIRHFNHFIANDRVVSAHYDPSGNEYRRTLYWTVDTTFRIVPPPVPEPPMAALAIAGLLVLARRHRCSPLRRSPR
ncbi:hypothetical protein [Pseudoduganella chitinolytica]|uniref:PEP-CTERM sorting domain-containing protein n=1 Tax=Pseudoduganella chitinolytica TaxID=34070 RepID=A0ABY8BAZ4_9BURK|nr:hypothetical protein [Pseudoduganella chitinolytica]WEF32166.1 hypothetical protein PX653_22515 [Pseudoduganella chitinolytica]